MLLLPLPLVSPLALSVKGWGNSACIARVTTASQDDAWCACSAG
jgi:hypothetical protein